MTVEAVGAIRMGARVAVTILTILFLSAAGTKASAQWTVGNTSHAWAGYNSAFLYTNGSGHDTFAAKENGSSAVSFWMFAEEIEIAVDAYSWAQTNDSGNLSSYASEITSLINGFNDAHASWWNGADSYDDDMLWATIAFTRAYQALGTAAWLTDAENGFNKVYSRGHANNGGIYWNSSCESGCSSWYENSAANWTFVIAGRLIDNNNGHTGSYKSEADSVYSWAKTNLYNAGTGQIYDGVNSSGTNAGQYSYNYGTAIGAGSEESDNTLISNVSNYLMNDLPNYNGVVGGYNILPNYDTAETGQDGGGFNGITMRWLHVADVHGSISSTVEAWARANITQAWSIREYSSGDPYYLMWDNWMSPTPTTGLYSWDCSSAMAGMFDWQ